MLEANLKKTVAHMRARQAVFKRQHWHLSLRFIEHNSVKSANIQTKCQKVRYSDDDMIFFFGLPLAVNLLLNE